MDEASFGQAPKLSRRVLGDASFACELRDVRPELPEALLLRVQEEVPVHGDADCRAFTWGLYLWHLRLDEGMRGGGIF